MKKEYFNSNGVEVEVIKSDYSIIWYNARLQGGKVLSWYTAPNNEKGFYKPDDKIYVVGLYSGGRVYKHQRYLYNYRDLIEHISFVYQSNIRMFAYGYNSSPTALLVKKLGGIY